MWRLLRRVECRVFPGISQCSRHLPALPYSANCTAVEAFISQSVDKDALEAPRVRVCVWPYAYWPSAPTAQYDTVYYMN